jgi:hypothetical protein
MLQNTVAGHHLGAAIGAMSFCRTLLGTIMVAVFGAIVLGGAPGQGPASAAGAAGQVFAATSTEPFSIVFLAAAGAMTLAFVAMLLVDEKPLQSTMPAARA